MNHLKVCGLKAALNSNGRYSYKAPDDVVDHLIVGGGVVGLAIARLLSLTFPEKTTYLVERNARAGEETSSRNSEVIHAGLYYPPNSLKESLCIRGRHLLYTYCERNRVPFRKTQKLVVAVERQRMYIEMLAAKARKMQWPVTVKCKDWGADIDTAAYPSEGDAVPTRLLSGGEARTLEPDLSKDIVAALLSTETGIIDSHAFMSALEEDISATENGELVYSTSVVRVDPYDSHHATKLTATDDGWVVQVQTSTPKNALPTNSVLARTLINASGLSSNLILNSLLPVSQRIPMYYARGSYVSYKGPGTTHVSRLIYPSPLPSSSPVRASHAHAFQSLGTHLTLDLNGNIRFGPDLQWISPRGGPRTGDRTSSMKTDLIATSISGRGEGVEDGSHSVAFSFDESNIDFWKQHLVPDDSQLEAMHNAVKTYLPHVDGMRLRADYVGIRPKLVPPEGGFQDFVFRRDFSRTFGQHHGGYDGDEHKPGHGQMITLMGIESPGLTASLAIAELVISMVRGMRP